MGEFRMPSLGADMETGTIVEWRVKPGDTVHRGDIVAVVDTEKSDIEVEVFEDGVIASLLVGPGVEVPVGAVLATITPLEREPRPSPPAALVTLGRPGPEASAPGTFVRASPMARRRAAELGVALARLSGSGPDGAVTAADVAADVAADAAAHATVHAPTEPRAEGDRRAAMRRAIGALMSRSKREIPHYYLATTINFGEAVAWLTAANETRPVSQRVLPAAVLLKATALAAREVPSMNGFWDDGFRPAPAVHLGVAISLRSGGLVAPAIHDADRLDLPALMGALADVVQRARAGTLRSSEMSDPTITVTNLGDQGAEEVFGVIYPPQVALVGFGRVVERPWVVAGALTTRPVVRATLAADHRVSDGHDGARFLAALDRLLQNPEEL